MVNLPFAVTLLAITGSLARYINKQGGDTTVVGRFFVIDPQTKEVLHGLTRQDTHAISNVNSLSVRLELGPDHPTFDMTLSRKSVWTKGSMLVERFGDQVSEVLNPDDGSCFITGRLTSHKGSCSFYACGKLSGLITTGDYLYSFEEDKEIVGLNISPLSVTISEVNETASNQDLLQEIQESMPLPLPDNRRVKRQTRTAVIEAAAYLDEGFVGWHYRNGRSLKYLQILIINKWNLMQEIYADFENFGLPIVLQLKKVEIWQKNPSYYQPRPEDTMSLVKRKFCNGTWNDKFDHRMLYTQGTSKDHYMGLATIGRICGREGGCSLVKSKYPDVNIEIHELGHNLGLYHDYQIRLPCTDPTGRGGFMKGLTSPYVLDCYANVLKSEFNLPRSQCLYRTDVDLPVLN